MAEYFFRQRIDVGIWNNGLEVHSQSQRRADPRSKRVTPTLGLYPGNGRITRFDQELVRSSIPGIRMVMLPSEFHAVQLFMAKQCARHVLYCAAQHDGIACDE